MDFSSMRPSNSYRMGRLCLVSLIAASILWGCAGTGAKEAVGPVSPPQRPNPGLPGGNNTVPVPSRPQPPSMAKPPDTALRPRFKELSPLDMQLVSMSFVDEDYKAIFQALSHAAGMNLVIDDSAVQLLGQGKRLTAEFFEQPVRDVLDSVCKALNLAWEERHGTIFILGYIEKTLNLDFIASSHTAKVTVGGDVLGGRGSSGQGITQEVKREHSNNDEYDGFYYDEHRGKWRDDRGEICHTCTPENGFPDHASHGRKYRSNDDLGQQIEQYLNDSLTQEDIRNLNNL